MTPQRMQEMIDSMLGTCATIGSLFTDEERDAGIDPFDDPKFCELFDDQIFLCETCGWYCEIGEQCEDGLCQDCTESGDD